VARLRRQLMRNGSQGKPVGLQLREALRGIESKWETVTPTEVRRALVSVGVMVPDDEMERLMKVRPKKPQTLNPTPQTPHPKSGMKIKDSALKLQNLDCPACATPNGEKTPEF